MEKIHNTIICDKELCFHYISLKFDSLSKVSQNLDMYIFTSPYVKFLENIFYSKTVGNRYSEILRKVTWNF